jgi:hypothetical protein
MVFVRTIIDPHVATCANVAALIDGAAVLRSGGTLNLRRGDFSAARLAELCNFSGMDWTRVTDDTPGELGLQLVYWDLPVSEVLERLTGCEWIEDYVVEV